MAIRRVLIENQRRERSTALIDISDLASAEDLRHSLADAGFRAHPVAIDGKILAKDATIANVCLEHGALLTTGDLPAARTDITSAPYLVVVAGPDSGHVIELPLHTDITVGRDTDCTLRLDDPILSGRHLSFRRNPGDRVLVTDLGSTNGTEFEGGHMLEPTVAVHGDHFHAGSSVLTVVHPLAEDFAVLADPVDGSRTLARQFRSAKEPLPKKIEPPRGGDDDDEPPRRSLWWRALLPVVSGVGFAAITGRWIFLLVVIISPIVMGVEGFRRKRDDAGRQLRKTARYLRELDEFRRTVGAVRISERRRRRDAANCGGIAILHSLARHRRLWERQVLDDDFLSVAVGMASLPSDVEARDPDDALPLLQWGTPLQHRLLHTGALSIVGSVDRGRAVARNLLINLAANHSPSDVRVWILTEDSEGDDWTSAQWLPHTLMGEDRSTIASTEHDRAQLIRSLNAIAEERSRSKNDALPIPAHVLIVDGAHLIAANELAALIADPTTSGITSITIDKSLSPEGSGATLRLGDNADESVFVSRDHPETEDVIITEVRAGTAEPAARRLAALRPATHAAAGSLGGTVHLVELEPAARLSGEQLEHHWRLHSPNTSAIIGATSDGPMRVDLVTDGPHGLIGGTSGSGKTEFLKTLFISLCLHNHPDDLSIVVVDFKGGVDHEAIKPLPHVIDVATNLDLAQFKRTIDLLRAESTRRQDMLAQAGASNLTAYRSARASDGSLLPLPRLLVVVDEFGELLSNADGKEQLKQLESITRIGRALGIHLLLVTQNFENSLPPQIDANAGLRVSLRVNKASHSKIVLDSDVAALIPDSRIGRGFARFHGRELTEFQTARVAGRRSDLATADVTATTQILPFELLAGPKLARRIDDVPAEETDMWAIIEHINDAATRSGWTRSAVPWPAALPEHVSIQRLADSYDGAGVAVGLADHPEEQQRSFTVLSERDEQVVIIGAPTSPVPEVMATYATALAVQRPADDLHIYAVDVLGRSLQALDDLPHTGSVAVRNDPLALRILRHVAAEAADRRNLLGESGASNIWEHAALGHPMPPQILLFVSGADRLLAADSPHQAVLSALHGLLVDAVGVRIQIVLGGLPRIVHNRLGMNIERRLILGLADPTEYGSVGVPKPFVGELDIARRCVDLPAGRLTQLARLGPPDQSDGEVIRNLSTQLRHPTRTPPRQLADVNWPLPMAQSGWEHAAAPGHFLQPLPVGLELESGEWAWIDAVDDGPFFPIAGSPKSGRSTALLFLAHMAHRRGWTVINVQHSRRSPLAAIDDRVMSQTTLDELEGAVSSTGGRVLVLVDDLHRLTDGDALKPVTEAAERTLLVAAGPTDLLSGRAGVMRSLPAPSGGLLLAPASALDGAAVGLRRLPDDWVIHRKAGRGPLAISGEARQVQIPYLSFEHRTGLQT